jgi:hypothetical protein
MGHLYPGQVLPIRLSRLTPPAGGDRPPLQGAEDPASVRYGQLEFLQVAPGRVTFQAAFRQADGSLGQPRTVSLGLGDSIDLAGTGLPDLTLQIPVKPLTANAAQVDYTLLAFRCDAFHTAMFALEPESFPGARYPYGISGVTPSGHFIFQSDHFDLVPAGAGAPAGRAALLAASPVRDVEPGPGDVLVDLRRGGISLIERARRGKRGWDLQFAQSCAPDQFRQVYGAAYMHVAGTPAQLAGRCSGRQEALDDGHIPDLVHLDGTWTLVDNAYGRVDLQVAARVGPAFDLSANLNFHGLSARLQAGVDETVRLAADCRIDRAWKQDLGSITLANPKLVFSVGGIPLSFTLPVTAGMSLEAELSGHALEGLEARDHWTWSEELAGTWGGRGVRMKASEPVAHHTFQVDALPENRMDVSGKVTLRPRIIAAPTFAIAGLLFGSCPTTLSAAGSLAASGPANPRLDPELSVRCQLDLDLGLDVPVLGKVWQHDWPVYDWTQTVGPRLR